MQMRPPTKSWSSTLRLPKSTFTPRPILADQPKYLKRCADDLYEWQSRERSAQTPFVLHDGPPYANGELHIGHALNKILKDIICRVKVQQGHRVVYVPGWDCHGLPIEVKALEALRLASKDSNAPLTLDAMGIRRAARKLASKTVIQQKKGFQQWGIMADWDKAWRTMDKEYTPKQLGVFQEMVKQGLIFRRYKPVYWSPSSRTALAEAELEYENGHVSTAAYVKFPITVWSEGLKTKVGETGSLYAVIWTTTPWTLPANRAIAVHSELEYTIVRHGEVMLLLASTRLAELTKMISGETPLEVVTESVMGSEIVGSEYTNVLRGKELVPQPIIHADFVSADSGSGLVHLAPGHGMDDYIVCTRLGIEAAAPVDDLGCFTAEAFPDDPRVLEGKAVLDGGSNAVLELLGDKVLDVHKYKHKYPYDWRTKLPVIVRATEQWFADVGHVKNDALQCLKDVCFVPDTGRARLESFVKGRSEWCISRQRSWGVPIPALYDEHGLAVLTVESVSHIISRIAETGVDAWWTDAGDEPAWILPGLTGTYTRGKDTMDVWFDSGTSWTQTEQQADIYLEGTDQHRGWFQSSLLTHTCGSGREGAPFKTLITHGFTLDQDGKKMSKSIGNVIAPQAIIDGSLLPPIKSKSGSNKKSPNGNVISQALGADALRHWAASSDYTRDISVGPASLLASHSALLKYRMIIKMLLGSLHPSSRTAPITKLDYIALSHLQAVMTEVEGHYAEFEFHKGVNAVNRWISGELSAVYLEAMKDRLYCGDGGGVLEIIFQGLLRMLSPITPFLVEEAWECRPAWMKEENQTHPFHQTLDHAIIPAELWEETQKLQEDFQWLMKANTAIKTLQEEARAKKLMGSSLESKVFLGLDSKAREVFDKYRDELASIFVVSEVEIIDVDDDKGARICLESEWGFGGKFEVMEGGALAWVMKPGGKKCARCWRHVAEKREELCGRCESVLGAV